MFLLSNSGFVLSVMRSSGAWPSLPRVLSGPYRFSRNPIYLAFSMLQLGIAMGVNSVWLLATLVGAVALMHYFVIPREEEYHYKASVRRWL
jgi:protein-S-isoprenylcysteine O-methyltransferase Ste14